MLPAQFRHFLLGVSATFLSFFTLIMANAEVDTMENSSREKRSIFPLCAPDGPSGCPSEYSYKTNVGVCGLATLNHFLNTTNMAGTCCYKLPTNPTTDTSNLFPEPTTATPVLLPQIIAYPVYAQYPYTVSGRSTFNSPTVNTNYNPDSSSYNFSQLNSYGNPQSYRYPPADSFRRTFNTPAPKRNIPTWPNPYGYPRLNSGVLPSMPPTFRSNNDQPPSSNMLWREQTTFGRQDGSSAPINSGGYPYPSSFNTAESTAPTVINPQNLAYPPLLSLSSIPVPDGSNFNPFPPAYSVSVYGSDSAVINALQTLLAQLLGTSQVSSTTINALQNTLTLAMKSPGRTVELTNMLYNVISLAQSTPGLNAATGETITALQTLVTTQNGTTIPANGVAASSSVVCSNMAVSVPSLAPQFTLYLNALQTQPGIPSSIITTLANFIATYQVAPVINSNAVSILTAPLASVSTTSGLSPFVAQSTANLQAALVTYTQMSGRSDTAVLLQTLYQLSASNANLDPTVFGGLGALVAQTAGMTLIPVDNPSQLLAEIREVTRYIGQSYQTPLSQLILAKIINCQVTFSCCHSGGATLNAGIITTTTISPIMSDAQQSYNYYSPSGSLSEQTSSYNGAGTYSSGYASNPYGNVPASYGSPALATYNQTPYTTSSYNPTTATTPLTITTTITKVTTTMSTTSAPTTYGSFPMAPDVNAPIKTKVLNQCGIPHASQQGDIALVMANGQKKPRANILRYKRGSSGRESRITNSIVARPMEICWMAAIFVDGKYRSGASIISEWLVLTAAHEIDGRDISRLKIRVGDIDVRQGSQDSKDKKVGCVQDLAVEKIIIHPDYDEVTLFNDIGLIKLKEPIDLNSPCVCRICLQETGPQEGETCIISGFGSTRLVDPALTKTEEEAFALSGPNAEILRYTGVPIMGNDLCSASFKNAQLAPKIKPPFGILDDTQICAGGISQRDACYGDGGSPLVCYNGEGFYQAGVVSYGRGCGKALMAAVYGSVVAASSWITEIINTQSN